MVFCWPRSASLPRLITFHRLSNSQGKRLHTLQDLFLVIASLISLPIILLTPPLLPLVFFEYLSIFQLLAFSCLLHLPERLPQNPCGQWPHRFQVFAQMQLTLHLTYYYKLPLYPVLLLISTQHLLAYLLRPLPDCLRKCRTHESRGPRFIHWPISTA